MVIKKREGFNGQEAIALPNKVLDQCDKNAYVSNIYTTWLGFYPTAAYHYRERKSGADENILIYCTEGCGEAIIENKKYRISPYDYLIVPAGKGHVYWADSETPWTIYWLHLKGTGSSYITDLLYRKMQIGNNKMLKSNEMINIFKTIYHTLQLGYSIENIFFCCLNLNHLVSLFLYPENSLVYDYKGREENFEKVIRFLKDNVERSIGLKAIAATANLSPAHFCNSFRKTTGLSPIEYFNHLKIQRACQLLQFTRHRINEISQMVGIEDPYYFSRLFNRTMGMSPKEYRSRLEFNQPVIKESVFNVNSL